MLLILTNSGDVTADYLGERLCTESVEHLRLNTDTLLDRLKLSYKPGSPQLLIDDKKFTPEDFSLVWYRRPEPLKSQDALKTPEERCILDEWSEALESFFAHIPPSRWMNFPAQNVLASRKLEQLTVAQQLGFAIPDSLLTQDETSLRSFLTNKKVKLL